MRFPLLSVIITICYGSSQEGPKSQQLQQGGCIFWGFADVVRGKGKLIQKKNSFEMREGSCAPALGKLLLEKMCNW